MLRSPCWATASSSVRPQVAIWGEVNTAEATLSYAGWASAWSPKTFLENIIPCAPRSPLPLSVPKTMQMMQYSCED